jgi:hypothetical protein
MQGGPVDAGAGVLGALFAGVFALAACAPSEPLACAAPTASGCPSLDGVTAFCRWSDWGCAPEPACAGYFVLADFGVDARFTYYYAAASGAFVATVKEDATGGNPSCLVGPSSFAAPSGCAVIALAACAPPPQDAGAGPTDAGTDAPFSPPAPSGSPSTQPLARPPRVPAYPAHPPR